jgi:hypothetical protein
VDGDGYAATVWEGQTGPVLAELDSASLAKFVTQDTGEVAAVPGSVAKLSQGAGGGGTGDAEQATLLEVQETVDAMAVSLAGAQVRVTRRVSGSSMTAYMEDDFRVRSGTALSLTVTDPAGALHAKLNAIGVAFLDFGASRENKPAGEITGTIESIAYAANVLTISIEISECAGDLRPGEYTYQIQSSQEHLVGGETEIDDFIELSGLLFVERRTVPARS